MDSKIPDAPKLSGKLYLKDAHLRADWGEFVDVFDLKQRTGWRILAPSKVYMELGSKDLSTYAPEMANGSPCPHAEVPSACSLVSNEVVGGRAAKKWDLNNPNKGFHVYFWTDDTTEITLRMAIGDAASYRVENLRSGLLTDSMFELPAGYEKLERPFRP